MYFGLFVVRLISIVFCVGIVGNEVDVERKYI